MKKDSINLAVFGALAIVVVLCVCSFGIGRLSGYNDGYDLGYKRGDERIKTIRDYEASQDSIINGYKSIASDCICELEKALK